MSLYWIENEKLFTLIRSYNNLLYSWISYLGRCLSDVYFRVLLHFLLCCQLIVKYCIPLQNPLANEMSAISLFTSQRFYIDFRFQRKLHRVAKLSIFDARAIPIFLLHIGMNHAFSEDCLGKRCKLTKQLLKSGSRNFLIVDSQAFLKSTIPRLNIVL